MRFQLVVLAAVAPLACFAPVDDRLDGGRAGGAAGGQGGGSMGGGSAGGVAGGAAGGSAASCVNDGQCAAGQRCYECGTRGLCAEGCSATKPCPLGQACVQVNQHCLTCPCPDSRCVTPSCLDEDGDGYLVQQCQGQPGGDCAPLDPAIHPGATEKCGNGRDDDCDGQIDQADSDCARLCGPAPSCGSVLDCNVGTSTCQGGCCAPCPVLAPPRCPTGQCLSPMAPNPETGCMGDLRCVPCATCPAVVMPVCAALSLGDARTFTNRCEATSAGAVVIHEGGCVRGEGLACGGLRPACAAGTYCREACLQCDADLARCTKVGACVNDSDCPAGLPAPMPCSNGSSGRLRCVNNACVQQCAP
ncbi:MAG: putative metal-binding motif-containing protein [Myxococcaceae bacterium]|nr:putative metal-binding motif-containing protein [Myxococcaceae bacterium]